MVSLAGECWQAVADPFFHLMAFADALILLAVINISMNLWAKYRVIKRCSATIKAFEDELKLTQLRRDLDEKWKL